MKFAVRTEIYLAALGTVHCSVSTHRTTSQLDSSSQHREDVVDFSTAPISTGAPATLQWVQRVLVLCDVTVDTSELYSGSCDSNFGPDADCFDSCFSDFLQCAQSHVCITRSRTQNSLSFLNSLFHPATQRYMFWAIQSPCIK